MDALVFPADRPPGDRGRSGRLRLLRVAREQVGELLALPAQRSAPWAQRVNASESSAPSTPPPSGASGTGVKADTSDKIKKALTKLRRSARRNADA